MSAGVQLTDASAPAARAARSRLLLQAVLIALPVLFMYADTVRTLAGEWLHDPNNSHGILIPPLVAYVVWLRRSQLRAVQIRPARLIGYLTVLASLAIFFVGRLGAELFLTRVSFIFLAAGLMLFFAGRPLLRLLGFPLVLLALVIPIPTLILNTIALPLQRLAASGSARFLNFCDIPVFRDGNVLHMAQTSLGVAEACSGLRSLMSLFALSIMLGYVRLDRWSARLVLIATAIPIAIALNIARITVTGFIANFWNVEYATGFFHTFSGWVVFLFAIALLLAFAWLIDRFLPKRSTPQCV